MQYILSEEEYQALTATKQAVDKNALLDLCRRAAKHIPISVSYGPGENSGPEGPWGCILDTFQQGRGPRYCDLCPSRHICPYDEKVWSK